MSTRIQLAILNIVAIACWTIFGALDGTGVIQRTLGLPGGVTARVLIAAAAGAAFGVFLVLTNSWILRQAKRGRGSE